MSEQIVEAVTGPGMRCVEQEQNGTLLLSEVIGAFSHALDITEGQPPGHCVRCCWIGSHIGHALGLPDDEQWDLYYTLLLKDAGCSSNAARLCQLYGCDDRLLKREFKTVNTHSLMQLSRFVFKHAGLERELADRLHILLNLIRNGERLAVEVIEARCERGADIARQLGFDERVAQAIRSLDEHWNGEGMPDRLGGAQIPLGARVALLAQVVDVFHYDAGKAAALAEIRARSGSWFDPELVEVFEAVAGNESFWTGLQSPDIERRVGALEPMVKKVEVTDDRLDAIAEAFGGVVDSKSPYTAGHSERVARYATELARQVGLPERRQRWLRRGAMLHDIGKLGISNSILDKPGALTAAEWDEMRLHSLYTEQILERIGPFKSLAIIAGAHHERLDGGGYPKGLGAAEISLETRVITVADVFDAITADRPYRGPVPVPEALEIMGRMVGTALDPDVFQALRLLVRDGAEEVAIPNASVSG